MKQKRRYKNSNDIHYFDYLGKEIAELVNENQQPGDYTVRFDANRLSSGIYFYRLSAKSKVSNNEFFKVGKMILLK